MAVRCMRCKKQVEEAKTELTLYKRIGRMAIYRPVCYKCLGYTDNVFEKLKDKFK